MNKLYDFILARLGEASTLRGLITVIGMCGAIITPENREALIISTLFIIGIINIVRKGSETEIKQIQSNDKSASGGHSRKASIPNGKTR